MAAENTDVSLSLHIHRASSLKEGGIDISSEVNNGFTGLSNVQNRLLRESME